MLFLFTALALFASTRPAAAQGTTAFTYQGQLRDGGTNANGTYTMTFKLYDDASGGNQIGGDITTSATLVNGLFTVNLDFGADAFNGSARWLDITVLDENLAPRVQVLPSPYALYSVSAQSAANLSGGTWNAAAGNFAGHSNVFGIFNNGSVMLGMSTNGSMINGNFEVTGNLNVDGGLSPGSLNFNNGGSISGNGQGGFNFNGLVENLSANNLSAGTMTANNLNLSSDLSANDLSVNNNVSANNLNITGGTFSWALIPIGASSTATAPVV